jgi:hypothetical protein
MSDTSLSTPNVDHLVGRLCPGAQLSEDDKRSLSRHLLFSFINSDGSEHWYDGDDISKTAEWTLDVPVGTYPNLNRLLQRLPDFREHYRDTRWPPEWAYYYIVDLEELDVAIGWPTGKLADTKATWDRYFAASRAYCRAGRQGPEPLVPDQPTADELERWVASRGGADCVADYVLAQLELEGIKRQAQRQESVFDDEPSWRVDAIIAVAVAEAEAGRPVNNRDRLTPRQLKAFRAAAKLSNMGERKIKDVLEDASGPDGPLVRIRGDSGHIAGFFPRENGDELSRKLRKRVQ